MLLPFNPLQILPLLRIPALTRSPCWRNNGTCTVPSVSSFAGWVFFILLGFVANWKLFETYFPMRQKLGGSDAYANLHRHLWGHLLALVAAFITALGVFIWQVIG